MKKQGKTGEIHVYNSVKYKGMCGTGLEIDLYYSIDGYGWVFLSLF
jgi:hypothetical protein